MPEQPQTPMRKSAMVGVVGRTNAGKSTVVNQMVGEKVSIVSPVEQTTRNTIRGIVEDPRGQLVLLDTPGLHKAVGPLGKLLNGMARASSAGVVVKEHPEKVVFALNKCDRSPFYETMFRDLWKEVTTGTTGSLPVDAGTTSTTCSLPVDAGTTSTTGSLPVEPRWVTCCGIRKGGCDALLDALFDLSTPGPALFPEDVVTDYPRKLAIADVVREKLIQRLRDEVPHEVGVAVKDLHEDRRRGWDVAVTIYVNRASQKGIVIGPRGSLLKAVRLSAEPELSDMFGVKVRLELWVKVEPNWMKNNRLLAEMGYLGATR